MAQVATARTAAPSFGHTLTGRFLEALFDTYENESVRYVVLRNYERWPEDFGKDIDLVVHPNDIQLSHGAIKRVARALGLHWTVRRKRSSHRTYYLFPAGAADGVERGILLDVRPDVVHQGLVYLPGPTVVDSRRRLGIFYVPSPALESLAILLHSVIDAGDVRASYRSRLAELGAGDDPEFQEAAATVVGPRLARLLAACLRAGEPRRAVPFRGRLLRAAARRQPGSVLAWVRCRTGAAFDRVRAFLRPPGHLVIIVGPDGAGKTTLSGLVCRRFEPTRIPASSVYLGAQSPRLFTRRLSRRIRKRFAAPGMAKPVKDVNRRLRLRGLVHIMADKWLRYLVEVRPRLVRGEVVVLDRYFYDLRTFHHPLVRRPLVDAFLMRLIPEPALAFCLRADPALIAARKNELTVAETARQLEAYRGIRRWVRNYHEVPADGHLPSVVDWISEQVARVYAQHRSPESI
jgi:thymidylate kinase